MVKTGTDELSLIFGNEATIRVQVLINLRENSTN
jgi:hypothetical protein